MSKVSVVVATYKREEELKNALVSLANQSFEDLEIVLVDDNADTERCAKVAGIVDGFRKEYPDAQLKFIVNEKNQGSARTRNIGIDACEGELITFLDDDDVYLPEKVKNQAEFMEKGGFDYSITDLYLYNEHGKRIDCRVRSYIKKTDPASLCAYHLKYHLTGTDTMMFTKKYLQSIGAFAPIDVGDEFYLMQRAIDGGGSFGYLPVCDIKAVVHSEMEGLSSGEGKIRGENALYEYKKSKLHKLGRSDRRYVRMRHFAVLAFAYLRMKKYGKFVLCALMGAMISPVGCLKMLKDSRGERK